MAIHDLSETRMGIARRCGLSSDDGEAVPRTVVDATGAPRVVNTALGRVATAGQVILLGSTRGTVEINVYKMVHRKAVVLSGAHETVLGDRAEKVLAESLELLAGGVLKTEPLMTHTIRPDALPGVYEQLRANPEEYLGVHVDWRKWND